MRGLTSEPSVQLHSGAVPSPADSINQWKLLRTEKGITAHSRGNLCQQKLAVPESILFMNINKLKDSASEDVSERKKSFFTFSFLPLSIDSGKFTYCQQLLSPSYRGFRFFVSILKIFAGKSSFYPENVIAEKQLCWRGALFRQTQ